MRKKFRPKMGEIYYSITLICGEFKTVFFEWVMSDADCGRYKTNNCFRDKKMAEKIKEKILKTLKKGR